MPTQSLFCSWDVGPRSQELQKFQPDCVPTLHHPSIPAFPSHDDQSPKQKKKTFENCSYRQIRSKLTHDPYLSEPFKAANSLTVSRSIFKTVPQPFFITHSDIIPGIHVTSICERRSCVKENWTLLG